MDVGISGRIQFVKTENNYNKQNPVRSNLAFRFIFSFFPTRYLLSTYDLLGSVVDPAWEGEDEQSIHQGPGRLIYIQRQLTKSLYLGRTPKQTEITQKLPRMTKS